MCAPHPLPLQYFRLKNDSMYAHVCCPPQGKAKPGSELQANIEQGFMARTFEPLPRLQGAALSV